MNALIALNKKLTGVTVQLKGVPLSMVTAAAVIVERSVSRQIAKDAPHRRVAGGTVGVVRKTLEIGQNPKVLVKATGPLHLLANPTDPHVIDVRHPRVSSRAHGRALRTPYGPKSVVNHPGTKGKNTWQRGVDEARPAVSNAVSQAAVSAVRAAFK